MFGSPGARLALDFLFGEGEMCALMREFDWSRTAIGAPDTWSLALRTTVRIMLANRFPLLLWWGPEYISIYNDAYRPILGRKHPWALGKPVRECWSEIWHVLKPLIDTPFQGGAATWSEDIELQIKRKGFTEETHFTVAYSAVPDETAPGGIGGVLATVHEITEKVIGERRTEILRDLGTRGVDANTADEACAISAATFSRHAKDIPFALLYLTEEEGTQARLAASFGVESPQMAPPRVNIADAGKPAWPLAAVLRSGEMQVVEKLGAKFKNVPQGIWPEPPNTAVVVPIRSNIAHQLAGFLVAGLSSHQRFDAACGNFLELAGRQVAIAIAGARAYEEERRRAEALAEIDRAKTAFFSNVSHEFRTPLSLMLGPLENLLAKGSGLAAEDREQVTIAHRSSLRLLKLVNSLLDFSRIEAGRMTATYAPLDLAALTADLASNFRSAMQAAGLEFTVECPPLGQPVFVDREMWEKIVLNLLSNAFKFTLAGKVTVRLETVGSDAALTIADTGIGIPEKELPHIFERFHRVEGAQGRTYEGTGIGLALIRDLVKLHGGAVEVSSRVGEGSTFTVTIPLGSAHLPQERLAAQPAAPARQPGMEAFTEEAMSWVARERAGTPAAAAGARPRILVADDNADLREHVCRVLGAEYEITAVADGLAAFEQAVKQPPELILSDVMMPRLDGFGLLRNLRGEPRTREVPMILLSARAGEEARAEGLAAGADDYLTKPFTARELTARVAATLRLQLLRREARIQFETLLDQAPMGVYLVDADFRIRQVNPAALPVFGDIPDLIGRDFDEVIHTLWPRHYADEIVERFRHTLQTGEPYIVPERVEERLDRGVKEYYEWRIDRMPLPDGRFGVVCYFRDISTQVQAREEIEALNARLSTSLAAMTRLQQLGTRLVQASELSSLLEEFNLAAIEITRADMGSIQLLQNGALQTAHQRGFDPRQVNWIARVEGQTASVCRQALRAGERVVVEDVTADHALGESPEGQAMLAAGVRALQSTPLVSRAGNVLGMLSTFYRRAGQPAEHDLRLLDLLARQAADLIENRLNSDALAASEARFRFVAESMPQKIFTAKPTGSVDYFNHQWMKYTGLPLEAISDWGWTQFIHPDELDENLRLWRRSLETGKPFRFIHRFRRADGAYRWHLSRTDPMRDREGAITMWIGSSTDIHDQKLTEEELRRANQNLEQFAYSASHDLQEPLRSVKIFSELLAAECQERLEGDAIEHLQFVRSGAERMETLVRDLLAYTQATRVKKPEEPVDAGECLAGALSNLAGAIAESGTTVQAEPLPKLLVQATHLQQLFQNLVGNAIKYRREGVPPVVRIAAERQGERWQFAVRDNGIGIDPEYRERIFGLFKRLHTSDQYSGTGIGLAICHRIVESYRGQIWVDSTPGEGSTFYFTLPA